MRPNRLPVRTSRNLLRRDTWAGSAQVGGTHHNASKSVAGWCVVNRVGVFLCWALEMEFVSGMTGVVRFLSYAREIFAP